jgi:PAS domain S-box-containing protein
MTRDLHLVEAPAPEWPVGGGEMGARIRDYDWSKNPLGPTANWPRSLKSAVELVLASCLPTKILWGPELIHLYNDAFAALIGDKHPAGFAQRAAEVYAEIFHLSAPLYGRAFAGEALSLHNQGWNIRRNGQEAEPISFLAYLTPLRDESGTVMGLHVACIETTEQVKIARERDLAEQALRHSETRLQTAADVIGLGCYGWNLKTDAHFWDFRARSVWGFPPEIRINREVIRARIHEDDRTKVDNAIIKSLDPGCGIFECEYRISRFDDGSERWIRARGKPVFENGQAVDFIAVMSDITEQKTAADTARSSETRLLNMLEQVPVAVGLFDTEGRVQQANARMRRFVDGVALASRDPLAGPRWRGVGSDGNRLAASDYPVTRALNGEAVSDMDFVHTAPDGRETWLKASATPFRKDDRVAGAILVISEGDTRVPGIRAAS